MNLIEGIQKEQRRFREQLIPAYESIGMAGQPALLMFIRPLLARSEKAIASDDVVEMLRVCQEMQETQA